MPDRSIVARLRAEASQFISTMDKARRATKSVGDEADQSSSKASKSFTGLAKSVQANSQHIDRLGNTALLAGGAIAAGLGYGIKAFADFDQAISAASAALPDAGAQMDDLRQLAIDLGKDTQFSATEAAQGITELAKAGVSASDILGGGLKGSLDLAAAGGIDVATAAETAASAMTQFKLEGDDVTHIADLLAAGAGKAQGSVGDLGAALNQTGLVASSTGLTIEETTAGLAAFASAGLTGSDAGTSFKTMLQRLTPQSAEAQAKMDELGISAYDAQGNFVGLSEFAGNLQTSLADLTPEARNSALAVIFGSDAVRGANVLYEQGAAGIDAWAGKVDDAGFAAKQAAALTDNLKGDLERLGGAIDSVFVQNGDAANGALRTLVQTVEDGVEAFGQLPGPVQQTVLGVAGLTSAGLLLAGGFAKAVTSAADMSESLEVIRSKSPKAAKGLDIATKAAKGLAIATTALVIAGQVAGDDIAGSLGVEKLTKDLLEADDAVAAIDQNLSGLADFDGRADSGIKSIGDALAATFNPSKVDQIDNTVGALKQMTGGENVGNIAVAADRLKEIDAALSGLVSGGNAREASSVFAQLSEVAKEQGISVDALKSKFPQYTEALAAASNQQTAATTTADGMGESLTGVEDSAETAKEAISALADEIRAFGEGALSADQAEAQFQESIDAATAAVKENGEVLKVNKGELDLSTEASRNAFSALTDLRDSTLENSAATLEATGNQAAATAEVKRGRDAFIAAAKQMGLTGKEAEALADKYGLVPSNVTTTVSAKGAEAARLSVQGLVDAVKALNSKSVTIGVRYVYSGKQPGGGRSTAGGQTIDSADGNMIVKSAAGMVRAYADGGMYDGSFRTAQPQIAKAGGKGILWAEEGAGDWEAFISGHPAKRGRSRMIAADTVARLGGRIEWARPFADGGILGSSGRLPSGPTAVDRSLHVSVSAEPGVAREYADVAARKAIRALQDTVNTYGLDR